MPTFTVGRIAVMAVCLIGGIAALIARKKIALPEQDDPGYKKAKKSRSRLMWVTSILFWLLCGLLLGPFAGESEGLHVTIMAPRMNFLGMDISTSVFYSWIVIAVLLVAALIIRIFVIPKFTEHPRGIQAVLEVMVSSAADYTKSTLHHASEGLSAYIFSLGLLMVGAAMVELFGQRPPTADLSMTFSMALCTFFIINIFGIRKKGVSGRIKSLAEPTPILLPIRVIVDCAIPISMACRLFGNMLGGLIIMHLVYMALGAFSIGVPAVMGLYFNMFHPLIQAFIFITLTLSFTAEATE